MLARIRNRLALLDTTQAVKMCNNGAIATFTFDDFPASAYSIAGKMLEDVGARGTYFAAAKFMDGEEDGEPFYTSDMIKEMHAKGHEISCHSFNHVHLGEKGAAFARASSIKNSTFMKGILGGAYQMTSFAYPYGDVSPSVKRAMGRRFALCRGVHQGLNTGSVDLAQIRIVSLESRHWNEAAFKETIARAKQQNSWVVFLTHDISPTPTPYGSTPEMIAIAIQTLRAASIPILTMKAAAAQVVFGRGY